MSAALPAPSETRGAPFGTASLVFAALTVVLPVAIGFLTAHQLDRDEAARQGNGWGGLLILLLGVAGIVVAAGLSSAAGAAAGIVALARGERAVWRPVVGLVVNVPVALFALYLVVAAWTGR